jgi:YHS domain-containing protein
MLSIVGVLIYRALKSWLGGGTENRSVGPKADGGRIENVLVKDPVCGTYFVQRDGVFLVRGDQRIAFCSEQCRDRYLARESADHQSQSF